MESVIGMINEFDTIAAIATAVSNAGIGIIRISGSEAMEILVKIFEPYNKKADVYQLENHRIYYGNINDNCSIIWIVFISLYLVKIYNHLHRNDYRNYNLVNNSKKN